MLSHQVNRQHVVIGESSMRIGLHKVRDITKWSWYCLLYNTSPDIAYYEVCRIGQTFVTKVKLFRKFTVGIYWNF